MKYSHRSKLLAFIAACSLATISASATLLSPGTSIGISLETSEPAGATLVTSSTVSFNGVDFANNILFSGTLTSSVWSGDTSNPFGGLTFTYQLSSALSSINSIDRLTLNRFSGFSTDVGYNGTGIIPSRVSRTVNGDLIAFVFEDANFLPTLAPGTSSPILVIQTSSSVWATGNASIIDGATVNVAAFVPLAVPEPATAGLLLLGAAVLAIRRKL